MPSTPTSSLRLEQQGAGENLNTWGDDRLNRLFRKTDKSIAGRTSLVLTGDHTLSSANYEDDEACAAILDFSGNLVEPATVTLPAVSKEYFVINSAAQRVTVKTSAGTGVDIPAGDILKIFCDGANTHKITDSTMATVAYVDAEILSLASIAADAEAARDAAQTAQTASEAAQTGAETAEINAGEQVILATGQADRAKAEADRAEVAANDASTLSHFPRPSFGESGDVPTINEVGEFEYIRGTDHAFNFFMMGA